MDKQRILPVLRAMSDRIVAEQYHNPYYTQHYMRTVTVAGKIYALVVYHKRAPMELRSDMIIPPMSYWGIRYGEERMRDDITELGTEIAQCATFESAVAVADDIYTQICQANNVTPPENSLFIRPRKELLCKQIITYELL